MIAELAGRLAVPGLPEWTGLLALLLVVLAAVSFLLMPFSVFGLKGRLDTLEAQLDEIQAELRHLAMRLPEPPARRHLAAQDGWEEPPALARGHAAPEPRPLRATPPIPPPPVEPDRRGARQEPRLR